MPKLRGYDRVLVKLTSTIAILACSPVALPVLYTVTRLRWRKLARSPPR